jgi:hypothetical protein
MIKEFAVWVPPFKLFVKQIFVSFISYVTLPFFHQNPNGVKIFFHNNYFNHPDGLIFDGATTGYFSKIERVFDFDTLSRYDIIDFGSGIGSLFYWIRSKKTSPHSYLGIDFAIEDFDLAQSASLKCSDIIGYESSPTTNSRLYFMCNVMCYLKNDQLESVLANLRAGDTLIIIEPTPNIFWDAHFHGIKPVYRTLDSTCGILCRNSFRIDNSIQDYFGKIKDIFFCPASYCICSVKI